MSRISNALIAHYKLNDNAASATVVDSAGSHNGTYKDSGGNINTSTGAMSGKINGALDFDGTDEYVEIADHADFTPALTPFSISAWCYMHDVTNFVIAAKGIDGSSSEWRFETFSLLNNKVQFILRDESNISYIGRRYNTALTENQWLHLVATYDGGTLEAGVKVYLDGIRVDDFSHSARVFVSVENLTAATWIGRYDTTYADGLIDNVMFFSIELTPIEVKQLYNNGHGTEIPADLDQVGVRARRSNNSPAPMRARYEGG